MRPPFGTVFELTVNDLIRKAREIEGIRARLIQAEQSGFTEQSRDKIRAEIRKEMRRNGELQDPPPLTDIP